MIPEDLIPRASLRLERGGQVVLAEREARLLEGISRTGSLKEGATHAGVSYRTAWACVQAMERALGRPVVTSRAGGPGGGHTALTDEARALLRTYDELSRRLEEDLRAVTSTA